MMTGSDKQRNSGYRPSLFGPPMICTPEEFAKYETELMYRSDPQTYGWPVMWLHGDTTPGRPESV